MSEDYTKVGEMLAPPKMESCAERRRRMSYGVEACLRRRLQFPFNIPMTWFEIDLKTH
jgi:hypothetical protein